MAKYTVYPATPFKTKLHLNLDTQCFVKKKYEKALLVSTCWMFFTIVSPNNR